MWPVESLVGSENSVPAPERIQVVFLYHLSPFLLEEVGLEAETGHVGANCFVLHHLLDCVSGCFSWR